MRFTPKHIILGDIIGPSVSIDLEGIEDFLQLPTGCGEQTIIKLAPTVYAATYLKHAGKLTPSLKKKADKFITEGITLA